MRGHRQPLNRIQRTRQLPAAPTAVTKTCLQAKDYVRETIT